MFFHVLSCSFIFFHFLSFSFVFFRFLSCSFMFFHFLSCSLNRMPEQVVDLPVPQIMEAVSPEWIRIPLCLRSWRTACRSYHRSACKIVRWSKLWVFLSLRSLRDGLPAVPQECVQNRTPEQLVDVPVPQIMEAIVDYRFPVQMVNSPVPQFMEATVENFVGEQIADSPVPQFMGADVEILHDAPQERTQTRTLEQTAAFPVPQISEERVPDHSPEQNLIFPVPQNMEVYAGRVRDIPLERAQHHSFVRPKRVFVGFLPLHKASKPYTGKVSTVNLRHHRDDEAFSDCVGFIRSLDKHNTPRLGDVMVPPPQIPKISWFDRKPQAAADEPLYRFHQRYSGRSGRSKLKR